MRSHIGRRRRAGEKVTSPPPSLQQDRVSRNPRQLQTGVFVAGGNLVSDHGTATFPEAALSGNDFCAGSPIPWTPYARFLKSGTSHVRLLRHPDRLGKRDLLR